MLEYDRQSSISIPRSSLVPRPPLPWYKRYVPNITAKRIVKTLALVTYILAGYFFYGQYEGWDMMRTLFFTISTISTVGYGYEHATTDPSRVFTIFYAILGVYVVYFYIGKEVSKSFGAAMKRFKSVSLDEEGKIFDKQKKTATLLIIIMICYVLISGGIFMAFEPEWTYIMGLYFAVQTTSVSFTQFNHSKT
jgi:hypothetical protein